MAAIFAFTCSCCGNLHEGSPSFSFKAPDQYACLSEEQKAEVGSRTSDLCTVTHNGHTDYFIRTILEVPIEGIEEPFLWGIWVSLSEKSFHRYLETYDVPVDGDCFFGWVCNAIPNYPETARGRPADVYAQPGGKRPKVWLHHQGHEDDALVVDQNEGISVARAQWLAEQAMHSMPPERP